MPGFGDIILIFPCANISQVSIKIFTGNTFSPTQMNLCPTVHAVLTGGHYQLSLARVILP